MSSQPSQRFRPQPRPFVAKLPAKPKAFNATATQPKLGLNAMTASEAAMSYYVRSRALSRTSDNAGRSDRSRPQTAKPNSKPVLAQKRAPALGYSDVVRVEDRSKNYVLLIKRLGETIAGEGTQTQMGGKTQKKKKKRSKTPASVSIRVSRRTEGRAQEGRKAAPSNDSRAAGRLYSQHV